MQPKEFFDSNPDDLAEVVKVVRQGFGRNLDFQDIYNHVTNPESVYLLRNEKINAMASYNETSFLGIPSLIVEGISLDPEVQGKGLFEMLTNQAIGHNKLVFLRTQNPRMYRALEKYCDGIYPCKKETPEIIKLSLQEFADYTKCKIDELGVVRGYYGSLFYGEEPTHCEISKFFKEDLKMDISKGDAVLAMGIR